MGNSLDNDFNTVLGLAGLETTTARFDPLMVGHFNDRSGVAQLVNAAWTNPWQAGFMLDSARRSVDATAGSPADTVSMMARTLGIATRRNLLESPIKRVMKETSQKGYLKTLLTKFKADGQLVGEVPDLSTVPEGAQQAASIVLRTMADAVVLRNLAVGSLAGTPQTFRSMIATGLESDDPAEAARNERTLRALDLRPLFAAGSDLAEATVEAQNLLGTVSPTQKYRVIFMTAWGTVILSGGSNDRYEGDLALAIDTGGNDVYVDLPRNSSPTNWASVVVDAVGDDRYVSDPELISTEMGKFGKRRIRSGLGPAGAAFGFAFISDGAGDDLYASHETGLGFAIAGGAAIFDRRGSDRYYGYKNAIGGAIGGFGLVEDAAGDDVYYGFTRIQGFGGTRGVGCVIDRAGRDQYVAEDKIIDFPSAQSALHNVSFAQGTGVGRRADYLDGMSQPGGVGLLFDLGGNDRYSCGVFGQGAGYWSGLGGLLDVEGDDSYSGQWYVQGSAAHFAVGVLRDMQGADVYTGPMNMAMGAGHDFSVGVLHDDGLQNDRYNAGSLSLGAANANGIGVFTDEGGDDFYSATGICLGQSSEAPKGTLRERALSFGVFWDAGGEDSYPVAAPYAGNGKRSTNWAYRQAAPESQVGVFLDR
ncbi:MAG: hypothetical protein JNJ45_10125 [Chthonomonas sp.]|nr:hypothetical protein [Chthonomonas sp.]